MIGYLQGTALGCDVVLVGGVGYEVATAEGLRDGELVQLWVHTAVRENDISLYGFPTKEHRALFLALTKVTGIGPRVALSILALGASTVAQALQVGDASVIARAAGVGKTKAELVARTVKVPADVLAELTGPAAAQVAGDAHPDLVAALTVMGHPHTAAQLAVATASDELGQDAPTAQLLRAALQHLGRAAVQ